MTNIYNHLVTWLLASIWCNETRVFYNSSWQRWHERSLFVWISMRWFTQWISWNHTLTHTIDINTHGWYTFSSKSNRWAKFSRSFARSIFICWPNEEWFGWKSTLYGSFELAIVKQQRRLYTYTHHVAAGSLKLYIQTIMYAFTDHERASFDK